MKNIFSKFTGLFKSQVEDIYTAEEIKTKRRNKIIIFIFSMIFLLPVIPSFFIGTKDAIKYVMNEQTFEDQRVSKDKLQDNDIQVSPDSLWKIRQQRVNDDLKQSIKTLDKKIEISSEKTKQEILKQVDGVQKSVLEAIDANDKKMQLWLQQAKNQQTPISEDELKKLEEKMKKYADSKIKPKKRFPKNGKLIPPPALVTGNEKKKDDEFGNFGDIVNGSTASNKKEEKEVVVDKEYDFNSQYIQTTSISSLDRGVNKEDKPKDFIIPMGAAKGIITTGVSLRTLSSGKSEPKPVFIKIVDDFVTTNNNHLKLSGCVVYGGAVGEFGTGVAEVRLENIQCTAVTDSGEEYIANGKIAKAWVFDESNLFGIESRVVTKEGEIFAKALPFALLNTAMDIATISAQNQYQIQAQGTSNGVLPLTVPFAQSATNETQKIVDRITDLWLKYLDTMTPIVQFRAGRKVTVAFSGITKLKWEKTHLFNSRYPLKDDEDYRNEL